MRVRFKELQFVLNSVLPSRRSPTAKRRRRSGKKRLLTVETLEHRVLLTADLFSSALTVDTSLFDTSKILVQLDNHATAEDLSSLVPGSSLKASSQYLPGLYEVHLSDDLSVNDALLTLGASDSVAYVEPDYRIELETIPNDPMFGSLWGLHNTGQAGGTSGADVSAVDVWSTTTGSNLTIVAVIDTGVDYTHPDLALNIWDNVGEIPGNGIDDDANGYVDDIHGYDFVNNDGDPLDDHGHGTHVAGTIGASGNNGVGIVGVNWNVQIMALKFLDGNGGGFTSDAVRALDYAVANGATVSNNSWGGGGASNALANAIQRAQNAGHIFVAAAGNNGTNNDSSPHYPSNYTYDNVISVAATDRNDRLASFSNYGNSSVDLAAPGVGILSTTPGNSYSTFNGTSMATPHVTGVVALLQSQHPNWSYSEVVDQVLSTVDPVSVLQGKVLTGGRLNAFAALGGGGPDVSGARVLSATPAGPTSGVVSSIRVAFNESINTTTFNAADVTSLQGPSGPINVSAVSPVAGTNSTEFDIHFAAQSNPGNYSLRIGPQIYDLAGNAMNQDGDGVNGESAGDQFVGTFAIHGVNTFGSTNIPVQIVDRATVSSTLFVDQMINITDVNVQLDIQHSYASDLSIYLRSPIGTQVTLVQNRGGSGDNFSGTIFDDEATNPITNGFAPFSGTYRPEHSLSTFDGQLSEGDWTLLVHDAYNYDQGSINGWSLTFEGPATNNPPQLAEIADRTIPASQDTLVIPLNATDPDGDTLYFSAGIHSTAEPYATTAFELDQDLGLFATGNYWEDWGGLNERWIRSSTGWTFITPDGGVYEWDGSGDLSTSKQIALLDASYHAQPSKLHDSTDPRSVAEIAYDLDQQHQLRATGNYYDNWGNMQEKWVHSPTAGWFFIKPNGQVHDWDGSHNLSTSPLVGTLNPSYHADPAKLHEAQPPVPSNSIGGNTVEILGNQLIVDPAAGFVGDIRLVVSVTDGQETVSQNLTVTVTSGGNQSGQVFVQALTEAALPKSSVVVAQDFALPVSQLIGQQVDTAAVDSTVESEDSGSDRDDEPTQSTSQDLPSSESGYGYALGELAGVEQFLTDLTHRDSLQELLGDMEQVSMSLRERLGREISCGH